MLTSAFLAKLNRIIFQIPLIQFRKLLKVWYPMKELQITFESTPSRTRISRFLRILLILSNKYFVYYNSWHKQLSRSYNKRKSREKTRFFKGNRIINICETIFRDSLRLL